MALIFHCSFYPHPLQYDLATILIRMWCLYLYSFTFVRCCDLLWPKEYAGKGSVLILNLHLKGSCVLLLLEECLFHENDPRNSYWKVRDHVEERWLIPRHWGHAWPASPSLILNLVSNTREKVSYAQESSYTLLYFGSFVCLSAPCPCNSKGSPSADAPPTAHSLKGNLPFEEAEEIHINWV